jgi:hypothetical protein
MRSELPSIRMTIELHHDVQMSVPVLKSALLYSSLAFAAGFVLGPVRMFILAPRVGAVVAVLIEAPLILTASFFIARWVLRRFATGASVRQRLTIGVVAFVMLMATEFMMSIALGVGQRAYLVSLFAPAGAIGLVGQVLFAFIPLLVRRWPRPRQPPGA